jgi:hypothetical protein
MGGACGKSSKDSESQRRSRFLSPESLPGPAGIQRALGTWSTSGKSFPSIRHSRPSLARPGDDTGPSNPGRI